MLPSLNGHLCYNGLIISSSLDVATMSSELNSDRSYRIGFLSLEPKHTSVNREHFKIHLKFLQQSDLIELTQLDQNQNMQLDLIVIDATILDTVAFEKWISQLITRMQKPNQIWTPALIMTSLGFDEMLKQLPPAARQNWYFDLVAPGELTSLPIRIANLLKIHDHLHELWRYEQSLRKLQQDVTLLEQQVLKLKTR
jgi:hypothetical protein